MDDEECSEFASGKKASSSGSSKKPSSPRYYVECFVRTEESYSPVSAGWAHPGWQHVYCWYLKMKYVVEAFRGFAAGDEKWQKGFAWSDKTPSPKLFIPLYIFTFIVLFLWLGPYLTGQLHPAENYGVLFIPLGVGVFLLCFSIKCWAGRYKPVRPWGLGVEPVSGNLERFFYPGYQILRGLSSDLW